MMHKECTAKGAIVSAQRDSEVEKGGRHPKMPLSSMPEVFPLQCPALIASSSLGPSGGPQLSYISARF